MSGIKKGLWEARRGDRIIRWLNLQKIKELEDQYWLQEGNWELASLYSETYDLLLDEINKVKEEDREHGKQTPDRVDELGFIEIHDEAMHEDFSDMVLVWVLDPNGNTKRLGLFREIKEMDLSIIRNKIFLWIRYSESHQIYPVMYEYIEENKAFQMMKSQRHDLLGSHQK